MQITLIVGNGFDKALGLPTGYQDFYDWWIGTNQKHEPKELCNKFTKLMKEQIGEKQDKWKDLEIGLGKFEFKFNKKDEYELANLFRDWKNHIDTKLKEYLLGINTSDTIHNRIDSEEIILKTVVFLRTFFWVQRTLDPKFFGKDAQTDKIQIHLIALNYTDSLNQIAKGMQNYNNEFLEIDAAVLHPHGTLNDKIILGVNDIGQIKDKIARATGFNCYLIKDKLREDSENCKMLQNYSMATIDKSDIVCLYGLSLGETDKDWWKKIGFWLGKKNHRLIVFWYSPEIPLNRENEINTITEIFFQNCNLSENEKYKRKKRISVIFNNKSNLFPQDILLAKDRTFYLPNCVSLHMVFVEAGTFRMGHNDGDRDALNDEFPHMVTLTKDYLIGQYVITQEQYEAVMGTNPSANNKGEKYPVENVSWDDAQEFCKKLNAKLSLQLPIGYEFRLPTEAEWEYAARGGKNSKGYKYSGSNTIGRVAWYDRNSGKMTHPIPEKQPNELGIYDMSGNVYEWCLDYYNSNETCKKDIVDPLCTTGSDRVERGGSWDSYARSCRVSHRNHTNPSSRYNFIGFRIVLATRRESDSKRLEDAQESISIS